MQHYTAQRIFRTVVLQTIATIALAVVVLLPVSATAQQPAPPQQPDTVFPTHAKHVLFIDDTVNPPAYHAFATNLKASTVLGKPVITGQFVFLNGSNPNVLAIVFLPTENPAEYWGVASNGYYMLVTIHPNLTLSWIDLVSGGPAFLF